MININIINVSDFPAIISSYEINTWKDFLIANNFQIENYSLNEKEESFEVFNSVLKSNEDEVILFSSWWFDTVNNIDLVIQNPWKWNKILVGFSDTLHIQSKFYNNNNFYILYGITLRNVFELNNYSKRILFNFIENQTFNINIQENIIKNNEIIWRLHWWHLMIFINIIDIYWIEILNWDILYLEFHWMEDYFIKYYLDILKIKWVFKKLSWIILDKDIDNYNKNELIDYLSNNWVPNIYSLDKIDFLPFYKNVTIKKWNLIMKI